MHDSRHYAGTTQGEMAARPSRFAGTTLVFAWFIIFLVVLIVFQIARVAAPAVSSTASDFFTERNGTRKEHFGILPEIWGTLYSSILGVAIGSFFGISVAIFLTQDFLPPAAGDLLKNIIELLAAIPSVVYGLWGIFVLIPAESARLQLAARPSRLDSDFRHASERPRHAAGGAGAGDHGAADDLGHLARFAGLGAAQAA